MQSSTLASCSGKMKPSGIVAPIHVSFATSMVTNPPGVEMNPDVAFPHLEPSRGKLVLAKSSRELLMGGEILMGYEGREDDTGESGEEDDHGDEEALLAGHLLGMLKEPAVPCWADSNDDEQRQQSPASLVCSYAFWSAAVGG